MEKKSFYRNEKHIQRELLCPTIMQRVSAKYMLHVHTVVCLSMQLIYTVTKRHVTEGLYEQHAHWSVCIHSVTYSEHFITMWITVYDPRCFERVLLRHETLECFDGIQKNLYDKVSPLLKFLSP